MRNIPERTIRPLEYEFLFYVDEYPPEPGVETDPQFVGQTPFGVRTVARCYGGGIFEGPKLKGTIVEACDWFNVLNNNGILDWRGTFKTDDGANLYMEMGGFIHENPESGEESGTALDKFVACANPDTVCNYKEYYFRASGKIHAGDPKYTWLNGLVCVAVGEFDSGYMRYSVYVIK